MENDNQLTITLTKTGRYTHLPERDMKTEIAKAEAKALRNIRRGHSLLRQYALPILPKHNRWDTDDSYQKRILEWLEARLATESEVHIHIFKEPRTRPCSSLTKAIVKLAGKHPHLNFHSVCSEDWGFERKKK